MESAKRTHELSATEAIDAVRRREVSAEELVEACSDRIDVADPDVRAWAFFERSTALERARAVDRKIASEGPTGRLAGVPIGIKDVFNTRDLPTQMGSPIWKGFQPGNDARVVYYLRMDDAVIMGKTVTAEFAVHTPGPTRNPHDLSRSPGTSSSGSAAAVAAGMVPLALGTQTAGSVIRPASYCGVYGFKPSFGLIPRTAVLKTTDSLDTVGTFARTVEDLELLFEVARVHGRDFPTSERALAERREGPFGPWKVAVVRGPKWDDAEAYAQIALYGLARRIGELDDFEVEELSLPSDFEGAHDVHSVIYDRTLSYYFRSEFRQHTLVSPVMYDIIRRGNEITLDNYKIALARQRDLALRLDEVFERYDVILDLSTGGEAPFFGEDDRPDNCLVWTMCGCPTISVPAFRGPDGLPYGVQVVGRRYADYRVLEFCGLLSKLLALDPLLVPEPLPSGVGSGAHSPRTRRPR